MSVAPTQILGIVGPWTTPAKPPSLTIGICPGVLGPAPARSPSPQVNATMGKSRMSSRQRSYEADLINRLSDNHQINQAQKRMNVWASRDRDIIDQQLSSRTKDRLRNSY